MKIVKELLTNPPAAIARAKREKDSNKVLSLLLAEAVLVGVSVMIISSIFGQTTAGATIASAVFFVVMIGILFSAFLIKTVMVTLGGRGKYREGLTAVVYGKFSLSLGIFISSILLYLPLLGSGLALLVLAASASLGISTFYRAVKELFNVDMITTWVGIGLTISGFILAVYILLLISFGGAPEILLGKSLLG